MRPSIQFSTICLRPSQKNARWNWVYQKKKNHDMFIGSAEISKGLVETVLLPQVGIAEFHRRKAFH